MVIIEAKEIKKDYYNHKLVTPVIKGINLSINKQDFISIVGPSGSGKTTLLYLLSGLENYTSGNITLFGQELSSYNEKEISNLRQNKIGFVFQFYNLIPNLNVYENVLLATVIANKSDKNQVEKVLEMVDMLEYKNYYPNQISGGMQQRVAIARALVNDPELIFADEPIGNLDYQNGIQIMNILKKLNQEYNKTIVLVTHNEDMIKYGTRFVRIIDGVIT
ncbi:MAG: ABC transporter ATP-binding protein, partial [Acholeplasmataceae bacterium]|nr:ABC transporter ATP-binding protein [Acholeplasmataceae bacterium]